MDSGDTRTEGENTEHSEARGDTIHIEGDSDDVAEGGLVGSMPGTGTGGLSDVTGGGSTRGDASGAFGIRTGGGAGGTGISGQDVNSTDAGRTDITGGGTASGLGGTSGSS